jgi:hypothetical protein
MNSLVIFVLIPLTLTIGLVPALPFSQADFHFTQICMDKVWIESTKGRIACVTSNTAEKLVQRGWGTLLDTIPNKSSILPSWNQGDSKQKIIFFVNSVTDPSSPFFVPSEDRIATFDNDGTLWIERPHLNFI